MLQVQLIKNLIGYWNDEWKCIVLYHTHDKNKADDVIQISVFLFTVMQDTILLLHKDPHQSDWEAFLNEGSDQSKIKLLKVTLVLCPY